MSKEERLIRRRRKKNIRLGITIGIVLFILFTFLPRLYSNNSDTYLANKKEIEKSIESKGVVVKEEKIYSSKGDGKLKFYYEEGEKVGKGQNLVSQTNGSLTTNYQSQIEELDKKISKLKEENKATNLFSGDLEKIQKDIDTLSKEISEKVKNNDTEGLNELKEKLNEKLDKKNEITQKSGFVGESISELEEKKDTLLENIKKNKNAYYSEESGIVSYLFDGYEDLYSYEKVLNMGPKDISFEEKSTINTEKLSSIEFGQPVLKVINNFKWYILADLPVGEAKDLNEGDNIIVRIKKDNTELMGKVNNIKSDKKDALILIELDSYLHKYYKDRFLEVDIVLERYDGLKIPSKAIVEKDGLQGVYTKNVDTIIKFKPVNILYEDEDFVIVDEGNRGTIYLGEDKESYTTVTSYDEVIINGNLIDKYMDE